MIQAKKLFLAGLLALVLALPVYAADEININTANVATLAAELAGIGPKKAQAIVDFRKEHGAFQTPHDITQVHGIGEKTYEKNKDKITVGDAKSSADVETVTDTDETSEPKADEEAPVTEQPKK